jgi:hypothetical protein
MDKIQRTLQNISTQILGAPLAPKDITLWEHYINKGGFSYDDFKDACYKMTEFANHVEFMYNERVVVYFGMDCMDCMNNEKTRTFPPFSEFWGIHSSTIKVWIDSGSGIEPTINAFIVNSPLFVVRCNEIVTNLFIYEIVVSGNSSVGMTIADDSTGSSVNPTDAHKAFYLDKYIKNPRYTIDELSKDIVAGVHKENAFVMECVHTQNSTFSFHIDKNANEHVHHAKKPKPFNIEVVDAFESVFQRPMFVQEYFKYIQGTDYADAADAGAGFNWPEMQARHNESYNRMREIFETYTGKTISEYYFVHRFLFAIDEPGFFDVIVDDIVLGGEYKNGMIKVLADRYVAMFDVAMSELDIDYIFEIVKKQKMDIVNEKLTTILTNLKEETDNMIGNIFKVYMNVLERPPDMNEIEQYVAYYRNGGVDAELEKVLMRTLEFHDSIKKKIRVEYVAKKNKEVLPSALFDILNRIIVKITELDMASIDETIQSYIV